jgi:ribose transport system substrate-binding protein
MEATWESTLFGFLIVVSPIVTGCRSAAGDAQRSSGVETAEQARSCTGLPPLARKGPYKIGFAQIYEPTNPYTIANTNGMMEEAKRRGHTLVYNPPSSPDPAEQIARVRELIQAKVDAIVLKPVAIISPSVIAARDACIPVFTESRSLDPVASAAGTDFVTHIGTDSVQEGQDVAEWVVRAKHGHGDIIEIEGTRSASSAIGRKQGFDARIGIEAGMRILASQPANFDTALARDVTKQLLTQNPTASVVYTHNDTMALGALDGIKDVGKVPGKDILIVSIDGFKSTVQLIIEGAIAAVDLNPANLGSVIFDTIEEYGRGERIAPRVVVKSRMIDKTNAAAMLAEAY